MYLQCINFLELIFEMCLVYLQYNNLLELEMIYNVFHVFVVHQSISIDQQCVWCILMHYLLEFQCVN
jgi:hypothetical protein